MSIRIMEQARDSMLERRRIVQESVEAAKETLASAERELSEIDVAIREQEIAIERTRKPKRRGRKGISRPRHDPTEGTKTHLVWRTISLYDGVISTGLICSKTGLSASSVKSIAADLVQRNLIERVSDGFFQVRQEEKELAEAA